MGGMSNIELRISNVEGKARPLPVMAEPENGQLCRVMTRTILLAGLSFLYVEAVGNGIVGWDVLASGACGLTKVKGTV
jgi:hypothetical protein